MPRKRKMLLGRDYVMRDGRAYYTSAYLATLGTCCHNQCTGCPWERVDPEEVQESKEQTRESCSDQVIATASSS
jgi:hypothetical protein